MKVSPVILLGLLFLQPMKIILSLITFPLERYLPPYVFGWVMVESTKICHLLSGILKGLIM